MSASAVFSLSPLVAKSSASIAATASAAIKPEERRRKSTVQIQGLID